MNVLIHVPIELIDGRSVIRTPAATRDLGILDAAEFVVLLPEIGFDDLGCSEPAQDCRVAACEVTMALLGQSGRDVLEHRNAGCHRSSGDNAVLQEGTPVDGLLRDWGNIFPGVLDRIRGCVVWEGSGFHIRYPLPF